ncbi:hypothetical protein SD51_12165 [Alicyclobacillus tengchongensis]|nr:hypothetical protein SD51_12165 [Alicyclobacillus tengchongensis]
MSPLQMQMYAWNGFTPTSDPQAQASYGASPEHFQMSPQAIHIVIVLAVILAAIYGLKIVGRLMSRGRD